MGSVSEHTPLEGTVSLYAKRLFTLTPYRNDTMMGEANTWVGKYVKSYQERACLSACGIFPTVTLLLARLDIRQRTVHVSFSVPCPSRSCDSSCLLSEPHFATRYARGLPPCYCMFWIKPASTCAHRPTTFGSPGMKMLVFGAHTGGTHRRVD